MSVCHSKRGEAIEKIFGYNALAFVITKACLIKFKKILNFFSNMELTKIYIQM